MYCCVSGHITSRGPATRQFEGHQSTPVSTRSLGQLPERALLLFAKSRRPTDNAGDWLAAVFRPHQRCSDPCFFFLGELDEPRVQEQLRNGFPKRQRSLPALQAVSFGTS